MSVSSASAGAGPRRARAGPPAAPSCATVSSRRRRACSLRSRSVSRREATRDQPAARVVRHARRAATACARGEQRLLHGVLGGVEVAVPADERAEDLRRQRAQQVLDARWSGTSELQVVEAVRLDDRPDVDVRSSRVRAVRMRACRRAGGDLGGPVEAVALDDRSSRPAPPAVSAYGPSVTTGYAVLQRTRRVCTGAVQALGVDELAGLDQFVVRTCHELVHRREVARASSRARRCPPAIAS